MLGFEALCALILPDACRRDVFNAAYVLRKTAQDAHYFVPQSGYENTIINMVDSDYGMRDTVVRVTDLWEVESEDEHGSIPTTCNLGLVTWGGAVLAAEIEMKLQELTAVDYNHHN